MANWFCYVFNVVCVVNVSAWVVIVPGQKCIIFFLKKVSTSLSTGSRIDSKSAYTATIPDVSVTGGCVITAGSTALWKTMLPAIWNLYVSCYCWKSIITGSKTAKAFSKTFRFLHVYSELLYTISQCFTSILQFKL